MSESVLSPEDDIAIDIVMVDRCLRHYGYAYWLADKTKVKDILSWAKSHHYHYRARQRWGLIEVIFTISRRFEDDVLLRYGRTGIPGKFIDVKEALISMKEAMPERLCV